MAIRRSRLLLALCALLAILLIAGYFAALRLLKSQIIEALGPNGEVQDLQVKALSVEITGLRIRAANRSWPAEHELRAARIVVKPDLRSLLSDTIIVSSIRIEQASLPMLRTAKGMQIVPSLLSRKKDEGKPAKSSTDAEPGKTIKLGRIELVDSEIDFFDATVARKPHHISITHLDGHLDNLVLPKLDQVAELDFEGQLPGEGKAPGKLSLRGPLTPSNLDSHVKLALRNVALVSLQPYFVKSADTRVKRGVMKLDLDSRVQKRQLHAPGNLQLDHLEVDGDGFAGISRRAALGLLADDKQRIDLQFSLDGNLDDPKFSLNEEFYTRVGTELAKALGVNFGNLGTGAGEVTKEIGGVLKNLLGK